mmetsp:Transcript_49498/g.115786  ORF Transcript_49498/g.115786 Transcript_49498/m.115786 type:complete len:200 (-) Transcript_49498:206-805(-)
MSYTKYGNRATHDRCCNGPINHRLTRLTCWACPKDTEPEAVQLPLLCQPLRSKEVIKVLLGQLATQFFTAGPNCEHGIATEDEHESDQRDALDARNTTNERTTCSGEEGRHVHAHVPQNEDGREYEVQGACEYKPVQVQAQVQLIVVLHARYPATNERHGCQGKPRVVNLGPEGDGMTKRLHSGEVVQEPQHRVDQHLH